MKNSMLFLLTFFLLSCESGKDLKQIVFIIGDEEYRSEESMPMLAELAKKHINAEVSFCYAVDNQGYANPNRLDSLSNLEKLKDADLAVFFLRFRALPQEQLNHILEYVESGRPMVGFRTSTHSFLYKDSSLLKYNNEWPKEIFGQQWITHHGHFKDGGQFLTKVETIDGLSHPILKGVKNSFGVYSWLYHVDGAGWTLAENCEPIAIGTALQSQHIISADSTRYPLSNPVAWTNNYLSANGSARVFFTTLGHPFDFKNENVRRLSLQGMIWALGEEESIPNDGIKLDNLHNYNPNNSGFGEQFKKNIRLN